LVKVKDAASSSPEAETHDDSTGKAPASRTEKRGAHYVAGPGFELAIRATLAHPLKVEVRGSAQDPKDRSGNADKDHRHESLERRVDALEKAVLMLADELQRLSRTIAELGKAPRE
jgi:hypothetical protein